MGPQKVALNQDSGVPAGVLRVISYVILTYTRTFSNRKPISLSKAHTLSYTHSKVGLNKCIFVEKGPLQSEL